MSHGEIVSTELTYEEKATVATTCIGIEMDGWDGWRNSTFVLSRLAGFKASWPGEYAKALSEQRMRRRNPLWGKDIE